MPPAPHSSVRPPNRHSGEGRNPEGWHARHPSVSTNHHAGFIPWCAGGSRHERLARKHVPDSEPGCALQSPSIPALRRRNVPNCRPMVDGGMRKCSAGACPPLGSGWGVAESAVQIRCTKPKLRLFIPSYENRWHPLDLPVSSFRRRPESRGVAGAAHTAPKRLHQPPRRFHTLVYRRQPA